MIAFECINPPTIMPSNSPIISSTVEILIEATIGDITESFWDKYFLEFAVGSICLVICILMMILLILRNAKSKNTDFDEYITNALAVVIAIGNYESEELITDHDVLDSYLTDLPVDRDIENLSQLFDLLNYKMIPTEFKITWTEEEIINYFENEIENELFNDEKELKYDALIVCVSCHGIENKIITSDYKTIEKAVLHRIIS
eukprot:390363_1